MNTTEKPDSQMIGSENVRRATFGNKHKVTVTFTRVNGLWTANELLLPKAVPNFRTARQIVARRLGCVELP